MNYKHVLVVIPNEELSETIENWLHEMSSDTDYIVVEHVRNEFEAKRRLMAQCGNPYHLIVMHISIPANRNSPINAKDQAGLKLLKTLPCQTPSILIAPSVPARLFYAARELHDCVPIAEGPHLQHQLVKYAKECLLKPGTNAPDERMRITFRLGSDKSEYTIDGVGGYHEENNIEIDASLMRSLLVASRSARTITAHPDWEDHLKSIGEMLTKKLFLDTYPLARSYWKLGGKAKIEICFDVARSVHPVILEAFIDPDSYFKSPHFWMLKAPMYRRLRNEMPTDRRPLFQGPREHQPRINCLIIESPEGGLVPEVMDSSGDALSLADLPNAAREAESLETYLTLKKEEFGLGKVLRLSSSGLQGENFRTKVYGELTRKDITYHLVHYAGHCHYDDNAKKGYVFFPEDGFLAPVELAEFSLWLSRTQFVYLSACRSSEEEVVFELTNNHVPSAIGFRWEIEDDAAAAYTSLFYEKLFEGGHRSLEYAFLDARQAMSANKQYEKKRIWAAPMLIMQLNDSEYYIPGAQAARGATT